MNSGQRPVLPRRELLRALLVALWNKAVELCVLAKVRWQRGVPGRFDRWALGAVHALMLGQIDRMRRICSGGEWGAASTGSSTGVHNAHVVLSATSPVWRTEAAREAALLQESLGSGSTVHHIGSTAIDGLAAKPVVDLAVALPAERFSEGLDRAVHKLHALGYRYLGVRGGYFFEKGPAPIRTHALQVHIAGSAELAELLRFRDALRNNAELRSEYEIVKATLATYFPRQRLLYVTYKFHWIAEWQWRSAAGQDWPSWFVAHKKSQGRLAGRMR